MNTQSVRFPLPASENHGWVLARLCPHATRRVTGRVAVRDQRAGTRRGERLEITASRWMAESA